MESLNENKVFESLQEREVREQIRSQKREAREATKEAEGSPLRRLVSYIEFGGIVILIGAFRKPLTLLAKRIFIDVDKELIKVDEALKTKLQTDELALRKKIINQHLLDPIQCYRFGGTIYNEMITNGQWDTTIYAQYDSVPSAVDANFTIGTGLGSIPVSSTLVRSLSVQFLGILDSLLITGQNLM